MLKKPADGRPEVLTEIRAENGHSEFPHKARLCVEGFGTGLLFSLAGLLSEKDPFFAAAGFAPQVIIPILIAAYLGGFAGYFSLAGEIAGCLFLSLLMRILGMHTEPVSLGALLNAARVQLALCLLATGLAGAIRDSGDRSRKRLIGRYRGLYLQTSRMAKVNEALGKLTDELERRVSSQRDSISILYSRMRRMDSLDMTRVLSGLLETVKSFAQTDSAAVYEYDNQQKKLVLAASAGPQPPLELPLKTSIEGWVFRNDTFFSLRMIDDLPSNLQGTAEDRPVLSYPLKSGDLPWGVLTIRDMPFQNYNLTTENNIGVIVALSASAIHKATDFRERLKDHPRDAVTGLSGYADFVLVLGQEIAKRADRRLPLSILIVELLEFEKIIFAYSGRKAFSLFADLAKIAEEESGGHALIFHYKSESQLAIILPDTDKDGLSYFCIALLQRILLRSWEIDGEAVHIEPAFGLATLPEAHNAAAAAPESPLPSAASPESAMPVSVEALISEAERVLSVSKSAFSGHTQSENKKDQL